MCYKLLLSQPSLKKMPGDFWIPLSFKAFNSGSLWGGQEDKWGGPGTSALKKCSSLFSEAPDSSLHVSDLCLQSRLQVCATCIPAQAQAGTTGGQGRLEESRRGIGQSFVLRPEWSWASSTYVSGVVRMPLNSLVLNIQHEEHHATGTSRRRWQLKSCDRKHKLVDRYTIFRTLWGRMVHQKFNPGPCPY